MHLLIVEDDSETAADIARDLASFGHSTAIARDGRDALSIAEDEHFDAIILDRLLPLIDGVEVLKRLRNRAEYIPMLMLSALGDLVHRVEGLESGVDDYLVKPAAPSELNARLHSIARRNARSTAPGNLCVGEVELDLTWQRVRYRGSSFAIQPVEFRILRELMIRAGKVVTRSMLLETVWGYYFEPGSNIVDLHVHKLRKRLREWGIDDFVVTVRGTGYSIGQS